MVVPANSWNHFSRRIALLFVHGVSLQFISKNSKTPTEFGPVRTLLSWARGHTASSYRDTVCAFATERWMPAASAAAVVTSQGLCCSRLYMVHGHRR